jgi:hypothetical protein
MSNTKPLNNNGMQSDNLLRWRWQIAADAKRQVCSEPGPAQV